MLFIEGWRKKLSKKIQLKPSSFALKKIMELKLIYIQL